MIEEVKEIKNIRKKLGINQVELARRADVSQSLIAKIESGNIDPTYSKTKRIFAALDELSHKNELTAEQIMEHKIITLSPKASISNAVTIMKKHAISQIPVMSSGSVVGLISEATIVQNLDKNLAKTKVAEIMEEAPPIVSKSTRFSVLQNMLNHFQLVLVTEKGKLLGIITKADVLRSVK